MGGETAAGSAASGFFLTILCFLAQCLTAFVRPLLQCYLALSMACCIRYTAMMMETTISTLPADLFLFTYLFRFVSFLPKYRRFAAPGTSLGGEVSGTFAGVAAGYSIAAGPCRAPHRPASGRERPHCRADFKRCFRSVSRRNPALEKRPRPCGHCVSWGGIFPAVSRHDAPAGSFVRMQPVLQPDREHPL